MVEKADGDVCERCRRIDITSVSRHYGVSVCDNCAAIIEKDFPTACQEGFD